MNIFIPHNTLFSNFIFSRLKLRLYKTYHLCIILQEVPLPAISTFVREINETSTDAKSSSSSMSSRCDIPEYSSFPCRQPSHPDGASMQTVHIRHQPNTTFTAPFCSIQSVNPPVDAPISIHTFPSRLISKCFIAFSSLSPPRLTY